MEENSQELMLKLSMYEQQIQQLQQQLQSIEQSLVELGSLSIGVGDLEGKKGKEIMAPIGRGIFVKAKVLEETLRVDIGNKIFVNKTIADTKKLIDEQIKKLEEVKKEMDDSLESLGNEIQGVIMDAQEKESKGKN